MRWCGRMVRRFAAHILIRTHASCASLGHPDFAGNLRDGRRSKAWHGLHSATAPAGAGESMHSEGCEAAVESPVEADRHPCRSAACEAVPSARGETAVPQIRTRPGWWPRPAHNDNLDSLAVRWVCRRRETKRVRRNRQAFLDWQFAGYPCWLSILRFLMYQ